MNLYRDVFELEARTDFCILPTLDTSILCTV